MRPGFLLLILAASAGCLVLACATGVTPVLLDDGTADSGTSSYAPPRTGRDGGTTPPATPDPSAPDPSDAAAPDAGKDAAVVDSGPPPATGAGDCVGTQSAQLASTYDDACDNYFFNVGTANPCTVGGTSCAALNTATLTFCCYKPPTGSNCWIDYLTKPQCVPK